MRVLSVPRVEAAAYTPDFSSTTTIAAYIRYAASARAIDAEALLKTLECESKLNADARGDEGRSYGIAQIYLPAHPEISRAQALDPQWAIDWTAARFAEGKQGMWTCWRALYKKTPPA